MASSIPNLNPLRDFLGLRRALKSAVWWKSPEEALATYPWETLFCRMLLHGLPAHREALVAHCGEDVARHVLSHAPAGEFSGAQWTEWHRRFRVFPVSPLPRRFAEMEPLHTPPWN